MFLPFVWVGFFLLGRSRPQIAAAFLSLASICFLGSWDVQGVPILVGSILVNYAAGYFILEYRRWALTICILAVVFDLTFLAFFKYADFMLWNVNELFGWSFPLLHIGLPLGISFYTFTQLAFLVDAYRKQVRDLSPTNYLLFVTYFPHLIAGPILHHATMMPQFAQRKVYQPQTAEITIGLVFFTMGLAKKVLLADSFALWANPIFAASATDTHIHFWDAWIGLLTYSLQIYFDFSGYSDMAVGLSKLFGIDIPFNFNSPYKSRSIIEFWKRWHITLSIFLRDYVYIPLGGNRRGSRYVNLIVTMLIGGLWHGASWTFVVWGGLHGFYLVVNHLWRYVKLKLAWQPSFLTRHCSLPLTFAVVLFAWIFFRAESFESAMRLIEATLSFHDIGKWDASVHSDTRVACYIGIGLTICWAFPNSQEISKRLGSLLQSWRWFYYGATIAMVLILLMINESRGVSEFIYFNF